MGTISTVRKYNNLTTSITLKEYPSEKESLIAAIVSQGYCFGTLFSECMINTSSEIFIKSGLIVMSATLAWDNSACASGLYSLDLLRLILNVN